MHFKVTARTILQLGAELISSDAIAFYELIKNAFDAKSKKVTVRVVIRFEKDFLDEQLMQLDTFNAKTPATKLDEFKQLILSRLDEDSFEAEGFKTRFINANTKERVSSTLRKSNYILILDTGEGMSMPDLEDIYLTIGTRNRRQQRQDNPNSTILGEKGLGRLSVMRLGDRLRVETTKSGEPNYSNLEIDWNIFSNDSDALLESIDIEPTIGKAKIDPNEQGTKIYVYDLRSEWSEEKLENIAKTQLSRFTDPFARKHSDFIKLRYNDKPIVLDNIDRKLFEHAHAVVTAEFSTGTNNQLIFSGRINYRLYNKEKTFRLEGPHLTSVLTDEENSVHSLEKLGPFKTEFYWFNRKIFQKKTGLGDEDLVRLLIKTWAGGLMLYRDGFRVNPYGGPDDDWLVLDPKAFSVGGYKLNRKQIVGKVEISSKDNPDLRDQTNREGLRDNAEKRMLVHLLQHLIWQEVWPFLNAVEKEYSQNIAVLSLNEIEKRIFLGQNQVRHAVDLLKDKYPVIKQETKLLNTIEDVLQDSAKLFAIAKTSAEELNNRLKTTLDLAGLGLMVDVIAHELNRSTEHAIATINSLSQNNDAQFSSTIATLKNQLKTLQARLKVIDPLGPSGRQQKVLTDIKSLIKETLDSHQGQFSRHDITFELIDNNTSENWNLKVVPGMIVQILENLISNSVYWIKQLQKTRRSFEGKLTIQIDRTNERILFTDNGPGIPCERKEEIFLPFVSTKPPGEGKGLGLYISRELAKYHKASLTLKDDNGSDYLNTFILSLKTT